MDSLPPVVTIPLLDGVARSKAPSRVRKHLLANGLGGQDEGTKRKEKQRHLDVVSLDCLFVKRLWSLARIMNMYPALVLVLLSIAHALIASQVGTVTGKFYATFVDKDKHGFMRLMLTSVGLYLGVTLLKSTMDWLAEFLALYWRKRLTWHLQKQYCERKRFYHAVLGDNPDQRMAQDLNIFCASLSQFLKVLAAMPFGVVWYTYLTYKATHSVGILLTAYVSFIVSFAVLRLMIGPIASSVFTQEKHEGNLRMAFVRLRNNAEQVAAFQGEATELVNLQGNLKSVLFYQGRVVMWRWLLGFVVTFLDYWGVILTYLCVGVVVFSGGFDDEDSSGNVAKRISNTSFFLMTLLYSFSTVQDASQKLSKVVGLTPRIAELAEELSRSEDEPQGDDDRQGALSKGMHGVSIEELTCETPGDERIVNDLSLSLNPGESLLVTGRNGCGKSTLMLVLMGLKKKNKGRVELPPPKEVMMLPQVPLLAPGGLLGEQLAYPSSVPVDHEQAMELLESVGLDGVWQRWVDGDLDQRKDWGTILSPGELQRICIARVLYHRPAVVILDESTSAVSADIEEEIYSKLKALGIIVISVGHNETLEAMHDKILKIHGKGYWSLT